MSAVSRRRWRNRPTLTTMVCSAIVVGIWIAMVVAVILGLCMALWVVQP